MKELLSFGIDQSSVPLHVQSGRQVHLKLSDVYNEVVREWPFNTGGGWENVIDKSIPCAEKIPPLSA